MVVSLAELAKFVGGQLIGDPNITINAVLPNDDANKDAIAFLSPDKSIDDAKKSNAGALLVRRGFGPAHVPTIEVLDPRQAALAIAARFRPPPPRPKPGIHAAAVVDPTAKIGQDCYIGPFAVVEADVTVADRTCIHAHAVVRYGSTLGSDVEIHPHAVLYPHTKLGDRVIVHSGVVLGCDGFGYTLTGDGHTKIPQLGQVCIADDVEIGANSTIDRGTIGATSIDKGTKLDNLVMVGHNCKIGKHNALAAQVGLAGSCKLGDFIFMGGKTGVADHVQIHDGAVFMGCSAVARNVPAGSRQMGYPARDIREFAAITAALGRLPQLVKTVADIRRRLDREDKNRKCA